MSRRGGQEGGYLEDIEGPDWRHGGQGQSYVMKDVFLPQGRYSENFVVISLLEVCEEGRVKKGGTWMTLRVPDHTLGGKCQPCWHKWCYLMIRKIP